MEILQRLFILGFFSTLMIGCAVPPKADTASGFPEIHISASVERVRSEVLTFAINQSYEIQTETPTTLIFGRDDTMEKSIWFMKRSRHIREFIMVGEGSRTRLIAKPYISRTCEQVSIFYSLPCPPPRTEWFLATDFYPMVESELRAVQTQVESVK
jgi:hypothetical protein